MLDTRISRRGLEFAAQLKKKDNNTALNIFTYVHTLYIITGNGEYIVTESNDALAYIAPIASRKAHRMKVR